MDEEASSQPDASARVLHGWSKSYGHLFEGRFDEVGDAMQRPRPASPLVRTAFRKWCPRPDSNRLHRLEKATDGLFGLNDNQALGLLLLGVAAGAPVLPKPAQLAWGAVACPVGLMVLPMVVTVGCVPLVLVGLPEIWDQIGTGVLFATLALVGVEDTPEVLVAGERGRRAPASTGAEV